MLENPTATARDIEERFGLQPTALVAALTGMVGKLGAGLCIQDACGRYLYVNARMVSLFGRSADQLIDRSDDEWLTLVESKALRDAEQAAVQRAESSTRDHVVVLAGQARNFSVTRQALQTIDRLGSPLLCSIWRERVSTPTTVASTLQPDALGPGPDAGAAANIGDGSVEQQVAIGRALFEEQLRRELDLSGREHREFSLVSIAIDPLQPEVMRQHVTARQQIEQLVERILRSNIRAMDASFRISVDRFVLLLSGVGLATAHSRVEALRRLCANESLVVDSEIVKFSLSIGVASYPHTAPDRAALVQAADTACELARRRGGDHVALASIRFTAE